MTHPDTKRYLLRLIEMERAIAYHKRLIGVLEKGKTGLFAEIISNPEAMPDFEAEDPFLVRGNDEVWEIDTILGDYDADFHLKAIQRQFVELDLSKESQEWVIETYKLVESDECDRAERWIDESPFMEPAVRIL